MLRLTLHRLLHTLGTLAAVSVLTFGLIQLPPGDFADSYANKKYQAGAVLTKEDLDEMRRQLGLDLDLPRFGGELVAHARPAISNWTGLW